MSNNKMEFFRDESKLHNVPNIIPTFMMIDIFVCFGCAIALIFGIVKQDVNMILIPCIIAGIGLIFSMFCDTYFNWYINCSYDLSKPKKIIYSFGLNGYSTGESRTVIVISKVKKFRIVGKNIVIRGDIEKKMPLRKSKTLNKITLQFDFDDTARAAVLQRLSEISI